MDASADSRRFGLFVALACHDLRTPLATVHGFARTLARGRTLDETQARYVSIIEEASTQLAELVDSLALVAQIESGRYQPVVQPTDPLVLARAAADLVGEDAVEVSGTGSPVAVEAGHAGRALAGLVDSTRRHGGVERVRIDVDDTRLTVSPVPPEAAPIVLAEDIRDLGAAAARSVVEAFGGSLAPADGSVVVQLPPWSG
jgi:signal transduction histidine kinase